MQARTRYRLSPLLLPCWHFAFQRAPLPGWSDGTVTGRVEKTGTWCSPWSPITHACPLISLFFRAIAYRALSSCPAEPDAPLRVHSRLFSEEIVIHVHRVRYRDEYTVIIMERPAALLQRQAGSRGGGQPSFLPRGPLENLPQIHRYPILWLSRDQVPDLDIETGMHKVQHLGPEKRLIYIIDYQFIDDAEHGCEVRHFAPDLSCPQYPKGMS